MKRVWWMIVFLMAAASLEAEVRLSGSLETNMGADLDNFTWGILHEERIAAVVDLGAREFELQFFARPTLAYSLLFRFASLEIRDRSLRYGFSEIPFLNTHTFKMDQSTGVLSLDKSAGPWQSPSISGGLGLGVAVEDWGRGSLIAASPWSYAEEERFKSVPKTAAQDPRALVLRGEALITPLSWIERDSFLWELQGLGWLVTPLSGLRIESRGLFYAFYQVPQTWSGGLRVETALVRLPLGTLAAGFGADYRSFVYIGKAPALSWGSGLRWRLPGPYGQESDLWGWRAQSVHSGLSLDAGLLGDDDPTTPADIFGSLTYYQSRKTGLAPGWGGWLALEGKTPVELVSQTSEVKIASEAGVEFKQGSGVFYGGLSENVSILVNFDQNGRWLTAAPVYHTFFRVGAGLEDLFPGLDFIFSWDSNDFNDGFGIKRDRLGRLVSTLRFRF